MGFMTKRPRIQLEHEGHALDMEIALCTSFWARLRGLVLSGPLGAKDGILLAPCNSVHTLGMSEAIEAVFLSKDLQILKISSPLKPWRSLSGCRRAWGVIEWQPGHALRLGLREGMQLKKRSPEQGATSLEAGR